MKNLIFVFLGARDCPSVNTKDFIFDIWLKEQISKIIIKYNE